MGDYIHLVISQIRMKIRVSSKSSQNRVTLNVHTSDSSVSYASEGY